MIDLAYGPGDHFGEYKIIELIGKGGMGFVYKAMHITSKRIVAIKIIFQKEFVVTRKRFLREAEVMGQLDHPNIVQIYSGGVVEGYFYLVMEYIDGETLDEYILRHRRMTAYQKTKLILPIAQALKYAHDLHFVHRDLKPRNIMVNRRGIVKLMDFGLAKNIVSDHFSLTQSGEFSGTPQYMAPEVLLGKPKEIDFRVDIYSFGAVLYEMIVGKVMIYGEDSDEIFANIRRGTSGQRLQNSPSKLQKIWRLCVAEKSERYSSTDLLIHDLENFVKHLNIKQNARFSPWVSVGIAIFVVICFCCMSLYYELPVKKSTLDESFVKKKIERLVSERNYEQAIYYLSEDYLEGSVETTSLLIEVFVKNQQYEKAKKIYERHYTKAKAVPPSVHLYMAVLYYRLKKEDHTRSLNLAYEHIDEFFKLKVANFFLLQKSYLYNGLCLLEDKKYKEALSFFTKVELDKDDVFSKLPFYIGICYYHSGYFDGALKYFEDALLLFSTDKEILFYLARCYYQKKLFSKAEKYISKCIQNHSGNTLYQALHAKILVGKNEIDKCQRILEKHLDKFHDFDTFEILSLLGVNKPDLQYRNFLLLRNRLTRNMLPPLPNLFREKLVYLGSRYFAIYENVEELKKKDKVDLNVVLRAILNNQNKDKVSFAWDTLKDFRYQKNFLDEFVEITQSFPPSTKVIFQNFYKKIVELKQREKNSSAYARMVKVFLAKNTMSAQKYIYKEDRKVACMTLKSSKNVFYKYLSAKYLSKLFDIQSLDSFCKPSYSLVTRIIATCVLREMDFPIRFVENDCRYKIYDLEISAEEETFLLYLVAQSMLSHAFFVHSLELKLDKNQKKFLQKMLKNKDDRIQVSALGCLLLSSEEDILKKLYLEKIVLFLDHNSSSIRRYAYLYLWEHLRNVDDAVMYFEYYKKGILDTNKENVMVNLCFSDLFKEYEKFSDLQPILESLIFKETVSPLIFRAGYVWAQIHPSEQYLSKILEDAKLPYIKKFFICTVLYIYLVSETDSKLDVDSLSNAIRLLRMLKNITPKISNEHFQVGMYFYLGLLGQPNIDDLKQGSNLVKLAIISHLWLPRTSKDFLQLVFRDTIPSVYQKKEWLRLYLNDNNVAIRKAAYASLSVLSKTSDLLLLKEKAENRNDIVMKEGIAFGLYNRLVYYEVIGRSQYTHYVLRNISLDSKYKQYIARLKVFSAQSGQLRNRWLKILDWAIELYPKGKYYYEKSVLLSHKMPNEAHRFLRKAVEFDENPLHRIELAKSLWVKYGRLAQQEITILLGGINNKKSEVLRSVADMYWTIGSFREARLLYVKLFVRDPFMLNNVERIKEMYESKNNERFLQFQKRATFCSEFFQRGKK